MTDPSFNATPPPAQGSVIEFYNVDLKHYFTTAFPEEAAGIDVGTAGPGWARTGYNFKTYDANSLHAGVSPVCRFYGTPGKGPNSHFYTVEAAECAAVKQDPGWTYEGIAYYMTHPSDGGCGDDELPVYRAYNRRAQLNDSNHRYTTNYAEYVRMLLAGHAAEGVVMCSPK